MEVKIWIGHGADIKTETNCHWLPTETNWITLSNKKKKPKETRNISALFVQSSRFVLLIIYLGTESFAPLKP